MYVGAPLCARRAASVAAFPVGFLHGDTRLLSKVPVHVGRRIGCLLLRLGRLDGACAPLCRAEVPGAKNLDYSEGQPAMRLQDDGSGFV
jgi:hypothetical protein